MQLYNGDRVKFLNEANEGVIVAFKGSFIAIVLDKNGFETEVHTDKLIKVSDSLQTSLQKTVVFNRDSCEKQHVNTIKKRVLPTVLEIDLHIEELVSNHKGLSNYEIVTIQINTFKQTLNKALKNKSVKRIVVIHGVGTGVLRTEIRAIIKEVYQLSYSDASYRKYGYGATEVFL